MRGSYSLWYILVRSLCVVDADRCAQILSVREFNEKKIEKLRKTAHKIGGPQVEPIRQ